MSEQLRSNLPVTPVTHPAHYHGSLVPFRGPVQCAIDWDNTDLDGWGLRYVAVTPDGTVLRGVRATSLTANL